MIDVDCVCEITPRNQPRKARSSYHLFCIATRLKIERELPDIPLHEVNKELGLRWRTLTPLERKVGRSSGSLSELIPGTNIDVG